MRIRILREAGGIGDIVRCAVIARALREKYPRAELWAFIAAPFVPLWERACRCRHVIPVQPHQRRPRLADPDPERWPYLAAPNGETFDLTVDLYDPAFRVECEQAHDNHLDRIDLWCRAAGVNPANKTPCLHLCAEDLGAADALLKAHGLSGNRGALIAVQPFSTDPARDWPEPKWRRLASLLQWTGHRVFVLDAAPGRVRAFPVPRMCSQPLPVAAALISRADLLIGPDSGLSHVAAAVGTPAVTLFGSQSGAQCTRYYPRALYVNPPPGTECPNGGRWPCFWRRPRGCGREEHRRDGRTCAAIGRIEIETVYDAATAWLTRPSHNVPQRVTGVVSARNSVSDGALLPRGDASTDTVQIAGRLSAGTFLEAFRVLRVGGSLHLKARDPIGRLPGMRPAERSRNGEWIRHRFIKANTWPDRERRGS